MEDNDHFNMADLQIFNTMAADAPEMQWAEASAAMVLTKFSQNIQVSALEHVEELILRIFKE